MTGRYATDAEIVAGVCSESDEGAEVEDGQEWRRRQLSREPDIRQEQKRKEKDAAKKCLEGCQEERRIIIGEMFERHGIACGADHGQELAKVAEQRVRCVVARVAGQT